MTLRPNPSMPALSPPPPLPPPACTHSTREYRSSAKSGTPASGQCTDQGGLSCGRAEGREGGLLLEYTRRGRGGAGRGGAAQRDADEREEDDERDHVVREAELVEIGARREGLVRRRREQPRLTASGAAQSPGGVAATHTWPPGATGHHRAPPGATWRRLAARSDGGLSVRPAQARPAPLARSLAAAVAPQFGDGLAGLARGPTMHAGGRAAIAKRSAAAAAEGRRGVRRPRRS
jgi:hypothetical protein